MYQIFMMVPVRNDGTPVKEGLRRGKVLRARGMVRLDHMFISQKGTKKEAMKEAVRLAHRTLVDQGYDTTVVGFGVRARLSRKNEFEWECTIPQVHDRLEKLYAAQGKEFSIKTKAA